MVEQKKELQKQHDQLEELNETKDRFFSIISHDLRGPIGVLNGTTLLIREYLESKDYVQLADLTANMEYSVKKVQHLLDNLLEWALSQQGKFSYYPEKVELNEIVHEVMGIFEGMAISKSILLTYHCKFDKFFLITDRNSMLTILRNLISNAIKFTNRNGSISIIAYKSEKSVILKVSDTGVGIPQKKLKTLFKINDNKSTWGTEREKGLGIGLSLVYEFVKMNNGTIDVESDEEKGTTFTLKFPTEVSLNKILLPQDI
jgi:signal transduction histidine kinase